MYSRCFKHFKENIGRTTKCSWPSVACRGTNGSASYVAIRCNSCALVMWPIAVRCIMFKIKRQLRTQEIQGHVLR